MKSKSMKSKSMKRKSMKSKSMKRKSMKRKSMKRKSMKRNDGMYRAIAPKAEYAPSVEPVFQDINHQRLYEEIKRMIRRFYDNAVDDHEMLSDVRDDILNSMRDLIQNNIHLQNLNNPHVQQEIRDNLMLNHVLIPRPVLTRTYGRFH